MPIDYVDKEQGSALRTKELLVFYLLLVLVIERYYGSYVRIARIPRWGPLRTGLKFSLRSNFDFFLFLTVTVIKEK